MPTIGLCIITKSLASVDPRIQMFKQLGYIDETYIQINGEFVDKQEDWPEYYLSRFKWNNNFADARNALLKEVKTDYYLWLDTDDTVEGIEHLRELVDEMEAQGIDKMFAVYHYAKNDLNEEIGDHWRERIIRTSHPYEWQGPVHETLISPVADVTAKTDRLVVIHNKDQADFEASVKRNHKILEHEYKKEPRDPRITMYLAMSYFTMRKWDEANDLFIEHIRTSGSLEDKYRSWLMVAECHGKVEELEKSVSACHEALKLLPNYPNAYLALAQFYYELEDYTRCLEWLHMGLAKPDPVTLSIVDPTLRYRTLTMGALAELQLGRVKVAYELLKQVLEVSPEYPLAKKWLPMFTQAYLESEAIEHTKWLVTFTHDTGGKPDKVLGSLGDLALDIRLNGVRSRLYPPKTWPEKSIVFFCGPASEPWGPDMLDKGIGGSEEAVIYLSRELAKLGWSVTIYGDREDACIDSGVIKHTENLGEADERSWYEPRPGVNYLPWHTFNPKDKFDVFVAWRNPHFFTQYPIHARVKAVDLHDTPIGHQTINKEHAESVDKFLFKSRMQRDMAKTVPDSKAAIISNGLVRTQFEEKS